MRIKTFTLVIVMCVASTAVLAAPAPWVAANQPDHLFRTKASNKDNGRQYTGALKGGGTATLGKEYTVGGATYDLDDLVWTDPTGATSSAETSWGVFALDTNEWLHEGGWSTIVDNKIGDLGVDIPWAPDDNLEVVGIFYGLKDNAVTFTEIPGVAGGVELIYDIKASDLTMDLWVQNKGQYETYWPIGPLDNPGDAMGVTGRFGAEKYVGVGYANTAGGLLPGAERVLRVESVGGYFLDEVIIAFNNTAFDGTMSAYLEVVAGTDPSDGLPHEWDGYVDRNPFPNNVGNPGGPYPNTADISILTNLDPSGIGSNNPAGNLWLLESEDPVAGATPVPGAALLGLIGLGTVGLVRRVRRRKQKT